MDTETLLRSLLSDTFRTEMQEACPNAYAALSSSKNRGGKWSVAETEWTDVLVDQFNSRLLPEVDANSSLRALLATATNSNAMRVTKRYSSRGSSVGKVGPLVDSLCFCAEAACIGSGRSRTLKRQAEPFAA